MVALGVDRSELDSVSLSWGVIEVSGTGVDAVVAEVIEDNDVAWKSLFQWNLLTHPRLLIYRVWKIDSELAVDELGVTGAVNAARGLTTGDVGGANQFRGSSHDVGTGDLSEARSEQIVSCHRSVIASKRSSHLEL